MTDSGSAMVITFIVMLSINLTVAYTVLAAIERWQVRRDVRIFPKCTVVEATLFAGLLTANFVWLAPLLNKV